ncbi:SDR family NAD(P)-dependent oxidoreductase [Streptomyces nodosus]
MATRLLEGGDRVAGTGRNTAVLEKIAARYGDAFRPATLDVTDTAAVKDSIDRAAAAPGNIDVAVNNAGYGMFGSAEEFTDEQIAHHLATNLTGSIAVARSVSPHLRANGGGRIVQIPAYSGQSAKPGGTATGFRRNAVFSKPLAAYDDTLAAMVRGLSGSTRPSPGDPAKVAAAIIAATETEPAPLRVGASPNASNATSTPSSRASHRKVWLRDVTRVPRTGHSGSWPGRLSGSLLFGAR